MQNLFEEFAKNSGFRALILAILGILTFIYPELIQNGMVYIIAIYVIICGVLGIKEIARNKTQSKSGISYVGVILFGLMIFLGALFMFYYRYIVGFLPLFLGAMMVVESVVYFVVALSSKKKMKPFLILISLALCGGGVVTTIYSFGFGGIVGLSHIIGVMLFVSCTYELALFLTGRKICERGVAL